MSQISTIIPQQSFELVRNQIGAILADELANQFVLSANSDLTDLVVWVERFVPFSHVELPAINVNLLDGNYDGQTVKQVDGTYRFAIDCMALARSNDDDLQTDGDKLASVKLQRIMGIVRAIIMDPVYKTLGIAAPLIMHRSIESLSILNPDKEGTQNVTIGRLVLLVKVPEIITLTDPGWIYQYDTTVKLDLTDKGYHYTGINY